MNVVAFNGSPRRNGNTSILIKTVLAELENEGITTELVELSGQEIHGCRACMICKKRKDGHCSDDNDIVNTCIDAMGAADGILLGSPTYFTDVTSEMKALIDRTGYVARANGNMFRRKVGAAVVAVRRAGAMHAFTTINQFFLVSEMIVPGSSYWNIGFGKDKGEVQSDKEGLDTMRDLGRNMAWLLQKLHAA